MSANPTIETISLLLFLFSLIVGALNWGPTFETISSLLFIGAIMLFSYEIWWTPNRYFSRRKATAPTAS